MSSQAASLALKTSDLWKQYSMGQVTVDALRGVNLEVPAGRFVVLLGSSGCGKTTLVNLAGGLDTPTRGALSVFGQDLAGLDDTQLTHFRRETVSFVFQMFNLVPTLTALENVQLVGQLVGNEKLAVQMLENVGLSQRMDQLPSQLSGGEQQRVAIARALVKQPRLLLADEPTGALDSETGREVLRLLWDETRRRDMTALMVTHEAGFERIGDMVIRMRSGEIVEVAKGEALDPRKLD